MPVRDWLLVAADERPGDLAVRDEREQLSYADLAAVAQRFAAALAERGVGAGTRVGLLLGDGVRFVALIHALRLLGAIAVPLNRRASPIELGRQLRDAQVPALVHDVGWRVLAHDAVRVTHLDPHPLVVDVDELPTRDAAPYALRTEIDLEAPATIVFTSGTSGQAKGAILTHGNHAASAQAWGRFLEPADTDRWLSCLPMYHVGGLATISRTVVWGVPLEVHAAFDPGAVNRAIDEDAISHLSLVAVTLERLLDERGSRPWPTSLRGVLLGGGPTPERIVRSALEGGMPIIPTYGLSETASGVTALAPTEAASRIASAGRPLAGVDLRISRDEVDCTPGEIGEIWVRGPMVTSGYVDPTGQARSPIHHGWLRTGDLGAIDGEGYLQVADRRLDLIVSGGENVYPAEIESVLREHSAIADAGVVGVSDPHWGAVPVAAVVVRGAEPVGDEELRGLVAARLGSYKAPSRFVRLDQLPRSAEGKLLRQDLRQLIDGDAPAPFPAREVERAGVRVAYRIDGEGPPLVLIHGTLYSRADWAPIMARFAPRWTVVAPDRRASGETHVKDPLAVTTLDHVADIAAILHAEGLGPAIVVGHSYGGCVALDLAARHPELVRAVVAYEPPYAIVAAPAVREELGRVSAATAAAYRTGGPPAAAEAFTRAMMGDEAYHRLPPSRREPLLLQGDAAAADAGLRGLAPELLPRISCPVVLVTGGASVPWYGPICQALAGIVPSARIEQLVGASHATPVTNPVLFGDFLEAMLRSLGFADTAPGT